MNSDVENEDVDEDAPDVDEEMFEDDCGFTLKTAENTEQDMGFVKDKNEVGEG